MRAAKSFGGGCATAIDSGQMQRALKEALRVDVDRNPDAAAWARRLRQHRAQETLQVGRSRRLGGEAKTMALAQHGNWRLGRAEQDDLVVSGLAAKRRDAPVLGRGQAMGGPGERASVRLRRAAVLGRDNDRGQAPERRQAAEPPLLGLFAIEPLGIA